MADFVLYSYQCHPEHTEIDPKKSLLTEFEAQENQRADENMARHQELFQEYFDGQDEPNRKHGDQIYFQHNGGYCVAKIMLSQQGVIMLRLQKDRTREYEVAFKMLKQKEQPSAMIIIDNRFEQQRVLIEHKKDVFAPSTIAKMMETNIGEWLTKKYRVGMKMPLVYKKDQFWNVVDEYRNAIKMMVFDFPYPNMARPMDKLGASLKKFGVDMKGKVRLVTKAQPRDFLVIAPREENSDLDEIVSYLSEVGSPVKIYLVSGRHVKCYSKDNPIVVNVHDKIANYRGEKEDSLFDTQFFDTVCQQLNDLKKINYGNLAG